MLLHQGTPSRSGNVAPPKLPSSTLNVVSAAARLLHRIIRQHLIMVQNVLSQEGISLGKFIATRFLPIVVYRVC